MWRGSRCRTVRILRSAMENSVAPASPALRARPIAVAWALAVAVDLFFNAGLFANLFNQDREPGLLPDEVLFRRIPVAYLVLAVGIVALAWIFDRADVGGGVHGAQVGGLAGLVFGLLGVVYLWTALDITAPFVGAAVLVQMVEFGAAGAFMGRYREGRPGRLYRSALVVAFLLALAGIVLQNVLTS